MENFINKFIEQNVKGVDTYQHNGSTWLIFTDDKKWVIELTEDKTLWYNYSFFKSIFDFFSMDVVENQHYITKWVEDIIINGLKKTLNTEYMPKVMVEDTIQNGVKETHSGCDLLINDYIEDAIQNGVRHTISKDQPLTTFVEDTIQNGVKETVGTLRRTLLGVDDIIQKGVKETNPVDVMKFFNNKMEDTLENGVKETNSTNFPNGNCGYIKEILRKGIKTVQPLPAQDGNRDWGNYYHGKEDRTKPFNEYLNEAIEFGVIAKTP
jgi:predicted peroxiredoxin